MIGSPLGAVAAFTSSGTWAYASTRYAAASRQVSPLRVNWIRMVVTLPIWLAIGLVQGGLFVNLAAHNVVWIIVATLCSYAVADNLFFAAAKRIGVASALSIASTYPLWAALKGTLMDGEAFGPMRAAGTLLCVSGVAAIIKLGERKSDAELSQLSSRGGGVLLALITSILWAGNTIANKSSQVGITVPTVNVIRHALALTILSATIGLSRPAGPKRPAQGWRPMLPAVLFDSVLGSWCFLYGLAHTDLAVGATLTSLAPLLSLPFAISLHDERISVAKLAAVAATVSGIILLATG